MNNEALTEKVSVNVNTATLSEIDLLVDGGYYSNRSDFINHALRSSLQEERATVERLIEQKKCPEVPDRTWFLGISNLSAEELRQAREAGVRLKIRGYGLLVVDRDVDDPLLFDAVEEISVRGRVQCSADAKKHFGLK